MIFYFQVCFDKTGTLTEDGLDFYMIRPVVEDSGDRQFGIETTDVRPEMQSGDEIIKVIFVLIRLKWFKAISIEQVSKDVSNAIEWN